jgi:hypothetical protein
VLYAVQFYDSSSRLKKVFYLVWWKDHSVTGEAYPLSWEPISCLKGCKELASAAPCANFTKNRENRLFQSLKRKMDQGRVIVKDSNKSKEIELEVRNWSDVLYYAEHFKTKPQAATLISAESRRRRQEERNFIAPESEEENVSEIEDLPLVEASGNVCGNESFSPLEVEKALAQLKEKEDVLLQHVKDFSKYQNLRDFLEAQAKLLAPQDVVTFMAQYDQRWSLDDLNLTLKESLVENPRWQFGEAAQNPQNYSISVPCLFCKRKLKFAELIWIERDTSCKWVKTDFGGLTRHLDQTKCAQKSSNLNTRSRQKPLIGSDLDLMDTPGDLIGPPEGSCLALLDQDPARAALIWSSTVQFSLSSLKEDEYAAMEGMTKSSSLIKEFESNLMKARDFYFGHPFFKKFVSYSSKYNAASTVNDEMGAGKIMTVYFLRVNLTNMTAASLENHLRLLVKDLTAFESLNSGTRYYAKTQQTRVLQSNSVAEEVQAFGKGAHHAGEVRTGKTVGKILKYHLMFVECMLRESLDANDTTWSVYLIYRVSCAIVPHLMKQFVLLGGFFSYEFAVFLTKSPFFLRNRSFFLEFAVFLTKSPFFL